MIRNLRAHNEFVIAVCVVPNTPEGLIVLTGSGNIIRAFAPLDAVDPESPRFTLEGHEKEGTFRIVTFLSSTKCVLVVVYTYKTRKISYLPVGSQCLRHIYSTLLMNEDNKTREFKRL